jgi:hypothetical protein
MPGPSHWGVSLVIDGMTAASEGGMYTEKYTREIGAELVSILLPKKCNCYFDRLLAIPTKESGHYS